ncbi:MAG: DNA-3-methyladenine glycosylase I [Halieaceae bacterium]|jgi:3-methyladenine DNA glycosylase Tag|nr:DNA-3-methyladenine glycosylase I [Halieaceae bacterium]
MGQFESIYERACDRAGGQARLAKLLPRVRSARALAKIGDDRYLSEMTRCVFQAGFVWRVVDNKWDAFEDVFFGFPPEKIVLLSPEQLEKFGQDKRIIRNLRKIVGVQHNARFILDVVAEHGSFGTFISHWPQEDLIGLFAHLKKHGSRLGGMTGQRVLRNMGRDTFVITGDVTRALRGAGLDIKEAPTSQRELRLIQNKFNEWHQSSGLPYSHVSKICAYSV